MISFDPSAENALFERWRKKRPEFCQDGIVDIEAYFSCSTKILFILKETNSPSGRGFNLLDFIREGAKRTYTWDNIARWTKGILNIEKNYAWKELKSIKTDKLEWLKKIAVLNIKKFPGIHTANDKEVYRTAVEDKDLIKEQINLYNPDIIIGCGKVVCDFINQHIFTQGEIYEAHNGILYTEFSQGKFFIRFRHPAARVPDNLLYFGLIEVVKELRGK